MNWIKTKIKNLFEKAASQHNKIFIFPTRYGLYFIAIVFILFLISLSYGHSLAFTTTFVFVSLVMVSAHFTNYNLAGLEVIACHPPAEYFEDQEGEVQVTVRNKGLKSRFDVELVLAGQFTAKPFDIGSTEVKSIAIPIKGIKRGEYFIPRVTLQTTFPFGLFQSWKFWQTPIRFHVYPKVWEEEIPLPHPEHREGARRGSKGSHDFGSEEFYGHFPYQEGMALKGIDWKAYARGRELLIKKFIEESEVRYVFVKDDLHGELENQIRHLATLSQQAYEKGLTYALVLKGETPIYGSGSNFKRECLKRLATYGQREVHLR